MGQEHAPAIGTSIVLSLDGQKVTGRVTAVQADKFVVRLPILQPAKAYQGLKARTLLGGGEEVAFDLGGASYYSELLIEIPLPKSGGAAPLAPFEGVKPAPVAAPRAGSPPATPVGDNAAVAAAAREALLAALLKPAVNKEELQAEPEVVVPVPDAKPPGDDRRRYFRFAFSCPVDIIENVGHVREYVREAGKTVNLSGGGMLARFENAVPAGTYRFKLHLPGDTMNLSGRIVKKGDPTSRIVAIEFIDLTEAERSRLIRFIFSMMRQLRQGVLSRQNAEAPSSEARTDKGKPQEKAYWRRREKYFGSSKIRYW